MVLAIAVFVGLLSLLTPAMAQQPCDSSKTNSGFVGCWVYQTGSDAYTLRIFKQSDGEYCGDGPVAARLVLTGGRPWPPTDNTVKGQTTCEFAKMDFPVLWGFRLCPGSTTELCGVAGGGRIIKTRTNSGKTEINWNDPVYGNDYEWKLVLEKGENKLVGKLWLGPGLGWWRGVTFNAAR